MSQPQPQNPTPQGPDKSEVVYRRTDLTGVQRSMGETLHARAREIAPAITPLIIGFMLLLALIMLQGYLSVRRTDEVSFRVLDLENQHVARLSLLLKLRLALTRLDNEARERQQANSRNELKPPFALRLNNA